jgi:hypothetical protein
MNVMLPRTLTNLDIARVRGNHSRFIQKTVASVPGI